MIGEIKDKQNKNLTRLFEVKSRLSKPIKEIKI